MSRYPPIVHQKSDSQSFGFSSYQRSDHDPSSNTRSKTPDQQFSHRRGSSTPKIHYAELNRWLYNGLAASARPAASRNNPRDKLIRLTRQQFQELSTDVYDELCRRIERGEHDGGEGRGGVPFLLPKDNYHPKRNQARQKLATLPRTRFKDLASDVFHELERRYPEFAEPEFPTHRQHPASPPKVRTPAMDLPQKHSLPFQSPPSSLAINPNVRTPAGMGLSAAVISNDVVVPDKSILVVDTNDAYGGAIPISEVHDPEKPNHSMSALEKTGHHHFRQDSSTRRISGSLSSIKYVNSAQHERNISSSTAEGARGLREGSNAAALKATPSDYERRISLMQSKIINLEKELSEALQRKTSPSLHDSRKIQALEEELLGWKERFSEQKEKNKQLEAALEDERGLKVRNAEEYDREIQKLKKQITDLNEKSHSNDHPKSSSVNPDQLSRVKAELTQLLDVLRQMQHKQEVLLAEKDADQEIIKELEEEALAQKKRYEATKTELRNLKRTSALHSPNIFVPEERLPLSEHGAVVDIHFTAFTTSINELLRAGRSNVSADVMAAMRVVIEAVGSVDEDIQQFELGSNVLNLEGQEKFEVLKERINSTLSNLITASKNHVVSLGLSPISLLDAAASHLCFSLIELVKLVGMRPANPSGVELSQGFSSYRSKYDDDEFREGDGDVAVLSGPKRTVGGSGNGLSPANSSPAPLRIQKSRSKEDIKVGSSLRSQQEESKYSDKSLMSKGRKLGSGSVPRTQSPGSNYSGNARDYQDRDHNGFRNQVNLNNKFDEIRSPSGFDESYASDLRDSASGSSMTYPDKVFDSPPRTLTGRGMVKESSSIGGVLNGFDPNSRGRRDVEEIRPGVGKEFGKFGLGGVAKADEGSNKELKVYLEKQTELIVGYIQSLLSAIRTGSIAAGPSEELSENLTKIITTVSSVVAITGDRLPKKNVETDRILNELSENCNRLSEMETRGTVKRPDGFTKQNKQAMAAASFGVAKALKELNSYVIGEDSLL